MTEQNKVTTRRKTILSAILVVVVLGLGYAATALLASQRKEPAQVELEERAIRVEVTPAKHEDVTVSLTGYGEAKPRDQITISPGISGKVVYVHPKLEVGEIVPANEILFKIDPRDYQARVEEAEATVEQLKSAVKRVERQFEIDKDRLEVFKRNRDLARAELERAQNLYSRDQIESKSFVEQREVAYNNAVDELTRLEQTLDLYPIQIQEARSNLAAAKAALTLREIDLERCTVLSKLPYRVESVNVEVNEYVTPSSDVAVLSDDSILNITVSLNSNDARKWLRFDTDVKKQPSGAWFDDLEPVTAFIAWTEAIDENAWHGTVARVERFDEETRTLSVVVQVTGKDARRPDAGRLPLVEGMFCRVQIPGRTAENVIGVPAEAVGYDQDASGYRTVYVAKKDNESGQYRLATRQVRESHIAGDLVYIKEGVDPGELIITTRLVNPLENTLLEIEEPLPVETD